MFYQVINGVDCFEVGVQQLLDWMGWTDYFRPSFVRSYNLDSFISYVNVGAYVVVEGAAFFGDLLCPNVCTFFRNLSDAVAFVNREVDSDFSPCRHDYEVWHVMDDGDLWQVWDHDSELSRVDAPVLLDERDIDGVELDHEQLWSLNVPGVGPVSFLWYLRRGELVEEYLIADWQSEQPKRLKGVGWYDWMSVEDLLACVQSYEMLRDAGSLDGGGRVGADF